MSSDIDAIFGIEPGGFIQGSQLAVLHGKGFVPVRRPGKLPAEVTTIPVGLDSYEVHTDAVKPGSRVMIVDGSPHSRAVLALRLTLESQGVHVSTWGV